MNLHASVRSPSLRYQDSGLQRAWSKPWNDGPHQYLVRGVFSCHEDDTEILMFSRQMMNDETHFPNPEKFLPERHENKVGLKPGDLDAENFEGGLTQTKETDPSSIVFGFGRRYASVYFNMKNPV